MDFAIVFMLDPCLCGLVEHSKTEVRYVLEHRHQSALDRSPQVLDLAVSLRGIRQRGLLHDAEPSETFCELRRRHGGAVVAQSCARQAALLKALR